MYLYLSCWSNEFSGRFLVLEKAKGYIFQLVAASWMHSESEKRLRILQMWEEPRNLALAGSGWQDGLCTSALVSLCERGDFLEWQMLEFETFYLLSSLPMALPLFTCRSYLTEGSSEELQGMYHPYQDSAERDVIFYLPPSLCWRKSNLLSSQPRFWWGKTGQISGNFPGSQFPILLVQSLLEAPLSDRLDVIANLNSSLSQMSQ